MLVVDVSFPSPHAIHFPPVCACCLAPTSAHRVIAVELGREFERDKWHQDYKTYRRVLDLKVPYCERCSAHAAAYDVSGLLMVASFLHIVTLGLFYLIVTKPLLEPFVQRSLRKRLGHVSCGGMQGLEVARVGDDLRFHFPNDAYARQFTSLNHAVVALPPGTRAA